MKFYMRPVMNKTLVLNASPIILLGKAGLLKIISPISKTWIIPEGVIKEIERKIEEEWKLLQI